MAGPWPMDEQDQASMRCTEMGTGRKKEVRQTNRYLRRTVAEGDERSGPDLERNQLACSRLK